MVCPQGCHSANWFLLKLSKVHLECFHIEALAAQNNLFDSSLRTHNSYFVFKRQIDMRKFSLSLGGIPTQWQLYVCPPKRIKHFQGHYTDMAKLPLMLYLWIICLQNERNGNQYLSDMNYVDFIFAVNFLVKYIKEKKS